MSAAYNYILSLANANVNLYKIGGPILISIGTVSCIINLTVFSKKTLRKNPCSIYLIACNVTNFLLIYISILIATLGTGYSIDPSAHSWIVCRLRYYITLVCDVLNPSYLILAAFDRILVTSRNALTRQHSTSRLAYICICIITLFWLIFHSHALIFTTILETAPDIAICYFQPGLYLSVISYYSLIIKALLIPILMVILGLWTVKNVRSMNHVTAVVNASTSGGVTIPGGVRTAHSKDRQLIKILLVDTSIYIFFNTMISIILIYQQIMQNQSQSYAQLYLQGFLTSVSVFSAFIPFCIGCYTNLWVSKTFRQEVKNTLTCK
ncbi:unnamed protein product [Adineta steineri]|uniref:G-protein coupled receptors family 1 profile domain-containing protein n=1 Tax=Adineta steineri TaxID=433720 RepID=A0A819S9H1_9BILA|nr:unnamed protein product [Adineta steineri]